MKWPSYKEEVKQIRIDKPGEQTAENIRGQEIKGGMKTVNRESVLKHLGNIKWY